MTLSNSTSPVKGQVLCSQLRSNKVISNLFFSFLSLTRQDLVAVGESSEPTALLYCPGLPLGRTDIQSECMATAPLLSTEIVSYHLANRLCQTPRCFHWSGRVDPHTEPPETTHDPKTNLQNLAAILGPLHSGPLHSDWLGLRPYLCLNIYRSLCFDGFSHC